MKVPSTITFEEVSVRWKGRNITDVFAENNNYTLKQTLKDYKYKSLSSLVQRKYKRNLNWPLGDFLCKLKYNGDPDYLKFLNEYGDSRFCEFSIDEYLCERGLYCFILENEIRYLGRCLDSFRNRINYGYGRICPTNCYKGGQSTNCRINALINTNSKRISLAIFCMSTYSIMEIQWLEKDLLQTYRPEWNFKY